MNQGPVPPMAGFSARAPHSWTESIPRAGHLHLELTPGCALKLSRQTDRPWVVVVNQLSEISHQPSTIIDSQRETMEPRKEWNGRMEMNGNEYNKWKS